MVVRQARGCISYDQMLILSTQLGNNVYTQFEFDSLSNKASFQCFHNIVVDNIDHNLSSRSTKYFWPGTAISSTRHLETKTAGLKRCSFQLTDTASKV